MQAVMVEQAKALLPSLFSNGGEQGRAPEPAGAEAGATASSVAVPADTGTILPEISVQSLPALLDAHPELKELIPGASTIPAMLKVPPWFAREWLTQTSETCR